MSRKYNAKDVVNSFLNDCEDDSSSDEEQNSIFNFEDDHLSLSSSSDSFLNLHMSDDEQILNQAELSEVNESQFLRRSSRHRGVCQSLKYKPDQLNEIIEKQTLKKAVKQQADVQVKKMKEKQTLKKKTGKQQVDVPVNKKTTKAIVEQATAKKATNVLDCYVKNYGPKGESQIIWTKSPSESLKNIDLKDNFTKTSGLKPPVDECSSISDFFRFFINEKMVSEIVEFTNLKLFLEKKENTEPVDNLEMYSFFGILLLLGLTKKNDVNISEIWCKESFDYFPYVATAMPRDRFKVLCNNITFDDLLSRDYRFDILNNIFFKIII